MSRTPPPEALTQLPIPLPPPAVVYALWWVVVAVLVVWLVIEIKEEFTRGRNRNQ